MLNRDQMTRTRRETALPSPNCHATPTGRHLTLDGLKFSVHQARAHAESSALSDVEAKAEPLPAAGLLYQRSALFAGLMHVKADVEDQRFSR
ncbi:hypothetical protein AVEN_93539-1 [Araneus ventricosus]|uniref:Uncharacterized protein n=1 Tax=Araneus ventricosus TaxID=182803 RepID=A0A4Y2APV4_ARAVE|nr:hypothetical protein AVEN_93539-1 [Araneus ventricosus]